MTLGDFMAVLPEVLLVIAASALLMFGVFRGERSTATVLALSVAAFAVAFLVVAINPSGDGTAFGGLFVVDGFGRFMKLLVLIASAASAVLSLRYIQRENMDRFEFPVIIVFATVGMMMMISANDLMSLYT